MGQGPTWTDAQRKARLDGLIARNRAQHGGRFLYEDAAWMRDAYIQRDLSLRAVAAEAGCGLRTVARWMKLHGIEAEPGKRERHNHPRRTGPDWHTWKGDDIGYTQAHNRVRDSRGVAHEHQCVHCLLCPAQQWAYDHSDPGERQFLPPGRSRAIAYSLDTAHYVPLCVKCHVRFDRDHRDQCG